MHSTCQQNLIVSDCNGDDDKNASAEIIQVAGRKKVDEGRFDDL